MALINFPLLYIPDPDIGRPLFAGKIYVGQPDTDPTIPANQKQLRVVQEDGTLVNISQPMVLSSGGVPVYDGSPVRLDVEGDYSLKILSRLDSQVYYISNVYDGAPVLFEDLQQYIPAEFATANTMIGATPINSLGAISWADYLGRKVSTVVHNTTSNEGGADYVIVNVNPSNLSTLVGGIWVGANHDLGGGYYARLVLDRGYVDPLEYGIIPNLPSDQYSAMQAAVSHAYSNRLPCKLLFKGSVKIDTPLVFFAGAEFTGSSGNLTGSSYNVLLWTDQAIDSILNVSSMHYGKIGGFNVRGSGTATTGLNATNTFGLTVSDMRCEDFTASGFRLKNDGTAIGCYGNELKNCYANACDVGFKVDESGSEINLCILNRCVATDCDYGFREVGGNVGRDLALIDCDFERCTTNIEISSKNFTIRGGYHEFSQYGVRVINQAGQPQQQGGLITGISFLGSYNFPGGAPTPSDSRAVLLSGCYGVTVKSCWMAYHKIAVEELSTARYSSIEDNFIGNCETRYSLLGYQSVVKKGNQSSLRTKQITTNGTLSAGENIITADVGNNNITLTLNVADDDYENGFQHTVAVIGTTSNTGTLTISDSGGATFFGQNGSTRMSGATSFVAIVGSLLTITRTSSTGWLVHSQKP